MNIAIIGSGGREHAICQKIYESPLSKKIYCMPGNAGTAKIAVNLSINLNNFKKVLQVIKFYKIKLVIIGPEEPLVNGLSDFLRKHRIKVFGPNKYAAKLEGSKSFVKYICRKKNIPTAKFKICKNKNDVIQFLKKNKLPLVVKADGLAAGKGVAICNTKNQVLDFSNTIFKGKYKSSKKLVLEEYLDGEEASYFLVVDKETYKFFGTAQDHKRVYVNDKGPNTGGMGAYSPAPLITKKIENKIINKIVKPTLDYLKSKKKFYNGFLYVGLMIKNNEPYLIEYNVRMGDPECQVILPRLKTDFVKIILKTAENKLKRIKINWNKFKSMTIVICSKGYPGKYQNQIKIKNLEKLNLKRNEFIFHAGTILLNKILFSNGGRVLNITTLGNNFLLIRKNIIRLIKKINWKNGFFRKDIGWRVIKKQ